MSFNVLTDKIILRVLYLEKLYLLDKHLKIFTGEGEKLPISMSIFKTVSPYRTYSILELNDIKDYNLEQAQKTNIDIVIDSVMTNNEKNIVYSRNKQREITSKTLNLDQLKIVIQINNDTQSSNKDTIYKLYYKNKPVFVQKIRETYDFEEAEYNYTTVVWLIQPQYEWIELLYNNYKIYCEAKAIDIVLHDFKMKYKTLEAYNEHKQKLYQNFFEGVSIMDGYVYE